MMLPEFIRISAKDALFNTKDIYEVFGYLCPANLAKAVAVGAFPKPDMANVPGQGKKRNLWRKATIVNEFERLMGVL